ncbi:MAG: cupin domain-containing protein [Bryobacteraceae bacterium]
MKCSRRDLGFLFPLVAVAQQQRQRLPSKAYAFDELSVRENGPNRSRAIFDGLTHNGFRIEIHNTELAPGQTPHAPHRHLRDEMVIVKEGAVEVTIEGRSSKLGPGSVVYINSNEEHGLRNVGANRAQYFILALGLDQ